MKIYLILQTRDRQGNKLNKRVYGITDDKKLAKRFMDFRNPNIFKLREEEYDKSTAYRTLDSFAECRLWNENLKTTSEYGGERTISIVTTQFESLKVIEFVDKIPYEIGKTTTPSTFVLSDKTLKLLDKLSYFEYMAEAILQGYEFDDKDLSGDFFRNLIPRQSKFKPGDEVSAFIYLYKWSLKQE